MRILALETSTPNGGAAVIIDGRIVAEETTRRQRSHSELLHVFIRTVLKKSGLDLADVDAFAVGRGPGSFTGIRVAANSGKALAAAFDKPVVTVDTLTQIASRTRDRSRPVLVLLNAYKNMVYYGVFDWNGDRPAVRKGPGVALVRELDGLIDEPMTVVGEGWTVYSDFFTTSAKNRLHRELTPEDDPTPGTLGLLAHAEAEQGRVLHWKDFAPLYLRASEAEENQRGTLFKPLDAKEPDHGKGRSS